MNNTNGYILTVHDELVSNLILMNCNNIIYYNDYPSKIATIKGKRVDISLVVTKDDKYNRFINKQKKSYKKLKMSESGDEVLKGNYSLSSSEIIIYLILLHHYIISDGENAVISIRQINREYRQMKGMNDYMYDRYIRAIQLLNRKQVYYRIKKKYVNNHKLVNYSDSHRLLNIVEVVPLNKDYRFIYNLGTLGKVIKDSRNYSTIIPKSVYSCTYANINYLLVFLYLSRIIYINRNQKRKQQALKRVSMRTLCMNICKYNRQGYNMNITYADVFDRNTSYIERLEFNNQFYELQEEEYSHISDRKWRYYGDKIKNSKKAIFKCINENRDLKMIIKNIKLCLTILKETHQIVDFNLIKPADIRPVLNETGRADWKEINGRNWDLFMIELYFYSLETQSIESKTQSSNKCVSSVETKDKKKTNIERDNNRGGANVRT